MAYVLANNEILKDREANLTPFLLNTPEVFKHSIWFGFGGIPLLNENVDIIAQELKLLRHDIPELLKNRRELFRLLKRMLNKNRYYRTGLITFQFFTSEDKIDYLVTCKAFRGVDFPINGQGLHLHIADIKLFSHSLSLNSRFIKTPVWKQVKAACKKNKNATVVILNEKEMVCEGIAANLFAVKENVLFTPAIETGCYTDVLRQEIIRLAKQLKRKVLETDNLELKHLKNMDEVFFVSEVQGIQWVLGFENRRYVHELTDQIYAALNKFLETKVENQK
ncbi:aminotransferase class IV [uncultured Draconibacterium sp.]|uniref:aminotransferase class IV n=1 Tax=uncultured Draconibacterium sp. TaxID=1573823 RepID=UPI002AA76DB2|nr:aminotransferase class IV [uncultured Draconibacterium sp.]